MASITCPCGAGISDVMSPSTTNRRLITERDLDAVTDYAKDDEPIKRDDFDARALDVEECWSCGRLLVADAWGNYTSYKKEA